MNSTKRYLLFLGFGLLLFSGCRRNKIQQTIVEIQKEAEAMEVKENLSSPSAIDLEVDESNIELLKIKTKVDLKSPLFSQSFPANIRLKKDSVMWISVAVGIEVGRALITQDSIFVIDRISKKYYELSMNEISRQFDFDLNYRLLQSLVLGDLPIEKTAKDSLALNSLYTSLYQKEGNLQIESQIDNVSHKLITILAEDMNNGARLGISYSDFWALENDLLPQTIFAKIDNTKKVGDPSTLLDLYHVKVDVGELNLKFPFNIPKSYEKGVITFPNN